MNRSSELLNPGIMEGSVPMASTSFSTSLMMNTSVPNQADQSQNYENTQWFARSAGMHSQQTNQPQFNQTYPNLTDINDMTFMQSIRSQQASQPQSNEAYQSQTDQTNSLQSTSGGVRQFQQPQLNQTDTLHPLQSISGGPMQCSQQASQPQLIEAYQSQTYQANSLQSTTGGVRMFQLTQLNQTDKSQIDTLQPLQSISGGPMQHSQQASEPQLNEAYWSQTDQSNSLQSTSGGVRQSQQSQLNQGGQSQTDQLNSLQSTSGGVRHSQQSQLNQGGQSQTDQLNSLQYTSGGLMCSQQTNQPHLNEAYQSQTDQSNLLQSTSGGVVGHSQQSELNQAVQNQNDQLNSPQFTGGRVMHFDETRQPQLSQGEPSQDSQQTKSGSGKTISEAEKIKRRLYCKNYRDREREKKRVANDMINSLRMEKDMLARSLQESIRSRNQIGNFQFHHKPDNQISNKLIIQDHHRTHSGEIDQISIEGIRALQKERDRLATVRRRCIEASTSSPQPNAPLSAQVRQSTIPQFHPPNFSAPAVAVDGFQTIFSGSQTSNNIKDPHRRISSSSGGIASCSHITEDEENSRAGTSTPMAELLMKINANRKSNVDFSDFIGLHLEQGERVRVGRYCFPKSLKCTAEKIIDEYGDVTKNSEMPISVDERTYILFCATIKEMDDHQLEEVTKETILKWSDAIKDALRIKFNVEFAMNHLKDNIVPAYIGRIEWQEVNNMDIRISKLEAELNASREERDKRHKQSMVYNDAIKKFNGKSISTGLFK
ncbi:hypothetical protein REPUB_Repub11eG0045500 [Reevesia pubescens]